MHPMLVWGVSNPEGVQNEQSIYLTKADIKDMVKQIEDASVSGKHIPVKVEHKGIDVGKVVSAWEYKGELQCVLQLDNKTLEGDFGREFVKQGITPDLSMGYEVSLKQSKNSSISVQKKWLKEISIVKRGARHNCHILGVSKHA